MDSSPKKTVNVAVPVDLEATLTILAKGRKMSVKELMVLAAKEFVDNHRAELSAPPRQGSLGF